MVPKTFMIIAGEISGDTLGAELVRALRKEFAEVETEPSSDLQPLHANLEPRFFGAGGPRMAEAGVELAFDMTTHAVFGLVDVVKRFPHFKRLFKQLLGLAIRRQPHAIICVDFSGFNRRFAHAIKEYVRARRGPFFDWDPKLIQYVSPQVWASRPRRARQMARDFDLVLSIFPFEREWYSARVPELRVEFVGHPIMDRYACFHSPASPFHPQFPLVLLLPGSRERELKRHLPVMIEAARRISQDKPVRFRIVLPNTGLTELAQRWAGSIPNLDIQAGGLPESLAQADLALASSGTVTVECAYFGVPAVVVYKLSWLEYQIAKRIVNVKHIAMPNLLLGEPLYPELIQGAATAGSIAREALALLNDPARRDQTKVSLAKVIQALGTPGASQRAAKAIVRRLWQDGRQTERRCI